MSKVFVKGIQHPVFHRNLRHAYRITIIASGSSTGMGNQCIVRIIITGYHRGKCEITIFRLHQERLIAMFPVCAISAGKRVSDKLDMPCAYCRLFRQASRTGQDKLMDSCLAEFTFGTFLYLQTMNALIYARYQMDQCIRSAYFHDFMQFAINKYIIITRSCFRNFH